VIESMRAFHRSRRKTQPVCLDPAKQRPHWLVLRNFQAN
jgi:hypothetical protein